jgi:iron complex outermembrane recepter protein
MKNYILYIFLMACQLMSGQNSLTGIVQTETGKPIANATVTILNSKNTTISNSIGIFEFQNIAQNAITISIKCLGFETQELKLNLVSNSNKIVVKMQEITFKMEEVIVSTAFDKLQSENVMRVAKESIASFEQKGASTLIEGLATIPGVTQLSTGVSIGKPVIRGLSGNRVLVYTQGVRLENQQFGDEHGLGINDAGISSVEVIKGPASLLYGSDALGGVLYFNPEKFAEKGTSNLDFSQKFYSNTLGTNSSLGFKSTGEKLAVMVRGTQLLHSDYAISGGERLSNSRSSETDFKTGLQYQTAKFSTVLRHNFNQLVLGINEDGFDFQNTSKSVENPKQVVTNHILSLNSKWYFEKSKLELDLGYINNERQEIEEDNHLHLGLDLQTLNYNLKYHLPNMGRFQTIVGVQGMHQENKNFGEEFLIPNAITNDIGVFATTQYSWKSSALVAGLRFDQRAITSNAHGDLGNEGYFESLHKNFNSINSSLGFKHDLSETKTIRINIASGFRAPNLAELSSNGAHEGTNRYEIGNTNLKTEQNLQADLDWEYQSNHFEFFVNGFYNHIKNYIFISPTGNFIEDNAVVEYTQSNANLFGGEVGLHFHPHPLDWLHVETSFETVQGLLENGSYLPLIPANQLKNNIKFDLNSFKKLKSTYVNFGLNTTFAQRKTALNETFSNPYTLVNLGFGGILDTKKCTFAFNINANNLLDTYYIAHLSRLKTDGIANMGRNIIASFQIGF